jgi:hypothetical protein
MQEHARVAVLPDHLSPWWRRAVILTLIVGFTVLIPCGRPQQLSARLPGVASRR